MTRACLLLPLLLLVACAQCDRNRCDVHTVRALDPNLSEFIRVVLAAECRWDLSCAPENGFAYDSLAACEREAEAALPSLVTAWQAAGFQVVDRGGIGACASAWFPEGDCQARIMPGACDAVFAQDQLTPEGGTCSTRACGAGLVCRADAAGPCSVCMVPAGLGGACFSAFLGSTICQPGLSCVSGRCEVSRTRGQPCAGNRDCRGFLWCTEDAQGVARCTDRVGPGVACTGGNCAPGLVCAGTPRVCQARPAKGSECSRNQTPACPGACVFCNASSDKGTCEDVPQGFSEGDACMYVPSLFGTVQPSCGEDDSLYADVEPDHAGCECRRRMPPGSRCEVSDQCSGARNCSNGRCTEPLADGERCITNFNCQSGFCDNTCKPNPFAVCGG